MSSSNFIEKVRVQGKLKKQSLLHEVRVTYISCSSRIILFYLLDLSQPQCGQLYNLFHSFDPISSRLEPIIDDSFANVRPAPVPRSHSFPFNDDIQYNASVLFDEPSQNIASSPSAPAATGEDSALLHSHSAVNRKASSTSVSSMARKLAYNDKAFCKYQTIMLTSI